MTPLEWMTDPNLCGKTFAGPTFHAARTLVAATFGLPMTDEQFETFKACTGRTTAPTTPTSRVSLIAGRGGGKTLLAVFLMVVMAASRNFKALLGPGELATIPMICPDRRQARVAMRYARGLLEQSPMLASLVVNETADSITLSTSSVMEITTANHRAPRGYSLGGGFIDEAGFLPTSESSANPDVELVRALMPGLARVPGSLLFVASSPYARRGILWDAYQRHHGVDDAPVLTFQAPTRVLNPTIPQSVVDEALEEDPEGARAEWLAEFRADIESYVSREAVERVVIPGRLELPPHVHGRGPRYFAFSDPSGGSQDAFTLAIAHHNQETGRVVLDCIRRRQPPFSPDDVVREFADVIRSYGTGTVTADRYGAEWVAERWRAHGIECRASERVKSEIYASFLPMVNAERVELLDDRRLQAELLSLERRTSRGGRNSIDHPPRGHDDTINSAAGACVLAEHPRATLLQEIDIW